MEHGVSEVDDVRPWVARLGSYIRIFGLPREGWEPINPRPGHGVTLQMTSTALLDNLVEKAQAREFEMNYHQKRARSHRSQGARRIIS